MVITDILGDRRAKIAFWSVCAIALVVIIAFMYLALAAWTVTTSAGGILYVINEDVTFFYNITVNNTDSLVNITQVNITLPSTFLYLTGSNNTDAVGTPVFSNTTSILTWNVIPTGIVLNGTIKFFAFNATASTPGSYNISIRLSNANATALMQETNITVVVNDTTAPTLIESATGFGIGTPVNNSLLTSNLGVNISATDNVGVSTIVIRLYNSSRAQINITSSVTSSFNFTFTGLSGTYYLNATVNDSAGNSNSTVTRSYILLSTSFQFNGTTKDDNGNILTNSSVNVTVRDTTWNVVGYVSTISNGTGSFNISIPSNSQWFYEPSLNHINNSFIDFKSKSIPAFPSFAVQMLAGATFYLSPAGTLNITAVNSTGARTTFRYQVKDTALGYIIAEDHVTLSGDVIIYVPRNRNYSIMIYPNQNMPVYFNWNNFTSPNSYSFSYSSSYNATTYTLHKQFNVTTGLPRVSGYVNFSGLNLNELTVVPYLLEPGNMAHARYGALPYNLSSANGAKSDTYSVAPNINGSAFYNITLPATAEVSTILLFAVARNGSQYIGGFRNVSLAYSTYASGGELNNFNFTGTAGLFGNLANISMDRIDGGASINITTNKQTFNLVNGSNSSMGNVSVHLEATVDYSGIGAVEFTWMAGLAQGDSVARLALPLLNTSGVKEMNIYASGGSGGQGDSGQYAPRSTSLTASQISTNSNITISNFNAGGINGAMSSGLISIGLYISNSSCDVPNPATVCILGSTQQEQTMDQFNPMQAIMGGGKVSFRMSVANITVHYVNVDMLASGPPDVLFDNLTETSAAGSSFDAAVRFGSGGPSIYDYIIVSMPYRETAGTGLDDSAQVNASIGVFYDENWKPIWNNSANGTNIGSFAGNFSHYSARQGEWAYLMNKSACITNQGLLNSSSPCFIDTTNNKIWMRLPHFSGAGPDIDGTLIAAATTTSSSSGSGGVASFWLSTFAHDKKEFKELGSVSREFLAKQRARIKVSNETHYVGVIDVTTTSATINISSPSWQETYKKGEEKKYDLNSDGAYDLSVKLQNIIANRANVTISYIQESISSESSSVPVPESTAVQEEEIQVAPPEEKTSSSLWTWVIAIIVGLIIVIGIVIYIKKK